MSQSNETDPESEYQTFESKAIQNIFDCFIKNNNHIIYHMRNQFSNLIKRRMREVKKFEEEKA